MAKGMKWTEQDLAEFQRRTQKKPGEKVGEMLANQRARQTLERAAPVKVPKFGNEKVTQDGVVHDSKKEARWWAEFQRQQSAGIISELKRQVPFVLAPAVRLLGEKRMKPAVRYVADFVYVHHGVQMIVDAKSAPTRKLPVYRLKKHLMKTTLNLDIIEI